MKRMVASYFEADAACGSFHTVRVGQPIAAILHRLITEPLKSSLYVQFAYTAPGMRRTGAAATLFEQAVSLARAKGTQEISARVQEWNVPSRRGLVASGRLQPIEHVYYRTLDRHHSQRSGVKSFADHDPQRKMALVEHMARLLASDMNHLRIRTAGVGMDIDTICDALTQYLRKSVQSYVLCDTVDVLQSSAFAVCEPVAHPFKDFLGVHTLHCNPQTMMGLLEQAMALAVNHDLPELGVRLFLDQIEMAGQLAQCGFVHSDTNYARWLA